MKIPFGFVLFILYLTLSTKEVSGTDISEDFDGYFNVLLSKSHRISRRDGENKIGHSEGESVTVKPIVATAPENPVYNLKDKIPEDPKNNISLPIVPTFTNKTTSITTGNMTSALPVVASTVEHIKNTSISVEKATPSVDVNNPGVLKRGSIVFGGFALLAIAYYVFYKRKSKGAETNNTHGNNENNQFRYGVLQSEDRRDNLELSRIPLTIESDEDEDEDLHVFDIEDRRKNMSYVNLQGGDEEIVNPSHTPKVDEGNNLLLDIDDGSPDTSMDWMQSSSKSIL